MIVKLKDNFSYFSMKPYVVRGHSICFYAKLTKIIIKYSILTGGLPFSKFSDLALFYTGITQLSTKFLFQFITSCHYRLVNSMRCGRMAVVNAY